MKLIYLSAPYTTGPDPVEKRQSDIDRATAFLMKYSGVYVFSPITYERPIKDVYGENMSWEFWGPKDAEMVSRCDELWVLCLKNWQASKGVNFEIAEAKRLGKPVLYYTANGDDWTTLLQSWEVPANA
jgi:nucleoside 2-deoxyribosyltransferase